jgi:dipeptidase D
MNTVFSGSYPGWKPKPGSEIVQLMEKIYTEKFTEKPHVVACHAGLECGIIGANYPEMEMVSFGPTIEEHTLRMKRQIFLLHRNSGVS